MANKLNTESDTEKKTNNINPIKTWEVNSRALKMTAFLVPLVTAIKTIQCNNFER